MSGVQQRAADVVVADLDRPFAHVGHVAVGAGHAAAGVDALAPHLELGVLGLEHLGAGLGVRPVRERPARRSSFSICSTFRPLCQG